MAISEYYKNLDQSIFDEVKEARTRLLVEIRDTFKEFGVDIWLDSGTLLGAIRDKDYIAWDSDTDVGMFARDWSDDLYQAVKDRFVITRNFFEKGLNTPMLTIALKGKNGKKLMINRRAIICDIFLMFPHEEKYLYAFWGKWTSNYKMSIPKWILDEGLEDYEFQGHTFKVPIKWKDYLVDRYGPGWVSPDPDFGWGSFKKDFKFKVNDYQYDWQNDQWTEGQKEQNDKAKTLF